jgi:hypothetical protein
MEVFGSIDPQTPLVVAESVWQYSHHVLHGLISHQAPILTVANWSGTWPGLVGMLNLNGSMTKAGVKYSTLWSENFDDEYFLRGLQRWLETGAATHRTAHVKPLAKAAVPPKAESVAARIAADLRRRKAILGVFDEGCMGMFNAIIPDELLFPLGVYKERLSQSALYYRATQVRDEEARAVFAWYRNKGFKFHFGVDEATELTEAQVLGQCKTYVAACRIADEFGCDVIGIQYQQGLKDLVPASDLAEGLLNNVERPPAYSRDGRELYAGRPLPHFNEVDECVGVDAVVTNRVWTAMGLDPATTLHDVRWGERYTAKDFDEFVWLFQISGAVPASHLVGGYKGAISERQPSMYFRLGGGTLKGVCKPGEVVWSRVFVEKDRLKVDLGRATAISLPEAETNRRWAEVTPQWPIMHVVLHGVDQNQFMARHPSNHINVAYAPSTEVANRALSTKATMFHKMGLEVHLCGVQL